MLFNSATLSYVQNTTLYLYMCVHFVYKSLIKKLICTRDDFSFFKLKIRNISLFRNINIHLPILKIIDNRQLIAIKRMITVEVDYLLHYNMLVIPRDLYQH